MGLKLDPNKLHAIINRIAAENHLPLMIRSMLFSRDTKLDIRRPALTQ